jgi:hypothetical protein
MQQVPQGTYRDVVRPSVLGGNRQPARPPLVLSSSRKATLRRTGQGKGKVKWAGLGWLGVGLGGRGRCDVLCGSAKCSELRGHLALNPTPNGGGLGKS